MKKGAYILFILTNLLVLNSFAQATIDSTNIDSLLLAKKEAYYPKTFTLEDSVFEVGSVLTLDINFYYGKTAVHEDSYYLLDSLISLLNNYEINIVINNHTDVRGKDVYNLKLSEYRARVVYEYLERKGIDIKRMEYLGMGESELIISKEETLALPTRKRPPQP